MIFAARLEDFGNQVALISTECGKISYLELASQADRIFAQKAAPKVRSLIAIECENRLNCVAGYLGALRGRFPVFMTDAQQADEMRRRIYLNYQIPFILNAAGEWEETGYTGPQVHPDVGVLLSTSGTTGSSKLVKLSYAAIEANACSISLYLDIHPEDRPITTLPMHYSYGLSVLNSHFFSGATVLLNKEPVTARGFWDFFRQCEASSFSGVPTTYRLLRGIRFERISLPSLRSMTQAGGRLEPEAIRWFAELAQKCDQRFFVMYGQTEATARIAYVPPERLIEKCGSIGIAIPDGSLDIIDGEGGLIDDVNSVGQLRYRGPNVMMGYAICAGDLAKPDSLGGVLLTGDLAFRDNEGYFFLKGRLNRFIKVFGNRISLDDIEAHLREQNYDVAVSGRDDLILIVAKGLDVDVELVAAHVASFYRLNRSAIRVVAVKEFPMASAGKILYQDLLKEFGS